MLLKIFNETPQNALLAMLQYLNVKHTKAYSTRLFNEHPHKDNLYGLSKMLSEYGVENAGTSIEEKEKDLLNIETPFVAFAGNSFVTVYNVTPDKVHYIWYGKNVAISHERFIKSWQNIILLAEANKNSIEPNYKENRKKELYKRTEKWLLSLSVLALIAGGYYSMQLFQNIGISLLLFINLIGVIIGYMLVQKQMKFNSSYTDKICSLFKMGDCNNVLETDAAEFWGIISWSVIGFGYFISNIILILIKPHLISFFAAINVCTLTYTFWSVWYQKFKAKQWCALCLIIQFFLWSIFILNLSFGFIQIPDLSFSNIIQIAIIYFIPVFAINMFIARLSEGNKTEIITQELNSIKANENVFVALLKSQPHFKVDRSTSSIYWGNPDSNMLISVITNPHCEPCAKMHLRIEKLLKNTAINFCIQYILTYFNTHKELISSNEFLIAAYLRNDIHQAQKIFNDWFTYGKYNRETFMKSFNGLSEPNEESVKEFIKHEKWLEDNKIKATPTILVNGYQLPFNYKIEDLEYFTKLELR